MGVGGVGVGGRGPEVTYDCYIKVNKDDDDASYFAPQYPRLYSQSTGVYVCVCARARVRVLLGAEANRKNT